MARRSLPRGGRGEVARGRGVNRAVRRAWPVALEAWRRWESLPDHRKEHYRKMAADYARRGREAMNARRGRRA
jgi:hypothetical protein